MKNLRLFITNKLFATIPETRGFGFKRTLLRWCGAEIGENVRICSSARILGSGQLKIGNNTWVGHQVLMVVSDRIEIGKDVNIAPRVFIGNGTHDITPQTNSIAGPGKSYPIKIGDGCWLCAASTILPGSELGAMSIVAANALYNSSSKEKGLLWAGTPATIRKRYELA